MLLCISLCELDSTSATRCERMPDVPKDAIPFLPTDLEQLIFEMAAYACKPEIPTLCRVAQRVKAWTLPIWYRVIIRQGDHDPSKSQSPPTPTQSLHVRDLLLTVSSTPQDVLIYLSLCKRVENLASWPRFEGSELLPMVTALPYLRRLSINLLTLFGGEKPDFGHEVWRNVTHLDIVDEFRGEWWDGVGVGVGGGVGGGGDERVYHATGSGNNAKKKRNTLTMIPKLTHIAFNDRVPKEVIIDLLSLDQIKVIVLLGDHLDELEEFLPTDPRLVTDVNSGLGGWVEDWRRGAEEGGDFWVRAEEMIELKKAKEKEKENGLGEEEEEEERQVVPPVVDIIDVDGVPMSMAMAVPMIGAGTAIAMEIPVQA